MIKQKYFLYTIYAKYDLVELKIHFSNRTIFKRHFPEGAEWLIMSLSLKDANKIKTDFIKNYCFNYKIKVKDLTTNQVIFLNFIDYFGDISEFIDKKTHFLEFYGIK